jgi:hypothetical protein
MNNIKTIYNIYNNNTKEYFEMHDKCYKKCESKKIMNIINDIDNDIDKYDDINRLCKIDCMSIIYSKLHNEPYTK